MLEPVRVSKEKKIKQHYLKNTMQVSRQSPRKR